jgi:hypothetical protein
VRPTISLFKSGSQNTRVLMCFCMGKHMCLTFSILKKNTVFKLLIKAERTFYFLFIYLFVCL